jgi:hypothetical protein
MSVSRPHPSAFVARNDAPLIDERARPGRVARRGRSGGCQRVPPLDPVPEAAAFVLPRYQQFA